MKLTMMGSPLHLACTNGHLKLVKYLVSKGANIALDRAGRTPTDDAKTKKCNKIVDYLKKQINNK